MPSRINSRLIIILLIIIFAILLINNQNVQNVPNLANFDSGSLIDSGYALGLTTLVIIIAFGFGRTLLSPIDLSSWPLITRTIIELPIGIAALGYLEFALGLAGLLNPIFQIGLLFTVTIISFKNCITILQEILKALSHLKTLFDKTSLLQKVIILAGTLTILLAFFQSLTPPWEYDGLMYHLQGPRLYLTAGKIIPIPENFFTYFPSTWEMVYMVGMGLGSDIFPRLMHFAATLLLLLAIYHIGSHVLGQFGGWIAAVLLIGTPIVLIWGGMSYNDVALALYQLLAFWVILLWSQNRKVKYLLLAGILLGIALGIKYTTFATTAIFIALLLYLNFNNKEQEKSWARAITNLLYFGGSALLIALPWYLRNWIWTGNPVFPYYFPQHIIDPATIQISFDYVSTFGTGKAWFDYLLLPLNIYLRPNAFGTFLVRWDRPNLLFLLTFLYPLVRRSFSNQKKQTLDFFAITALLQFIYWAISSQQNRFLLSTYPYLCILTGAILIQVINKIDQIAIRQLVSTTVMGAVIFSSLAVLGIFFLGIKPYQVIFNLQTKADFLSRMIDDFTAIEYINQEMSDDSKVFMLLDGRAYYCKEGKCVPDIPQATWTALVNHNNTNEAVSAWLEDQEITHILLTWNDAAYFLNGHDPDHLHEEAVDFFLNQYAPECTILIYENSNSQLFQLLSSNCN